VAKRLSFSLFYPYATEKEVRRAVMLMGPRRVGKTVMPFHSIQQLLEEGRTEGEVDLVLVDDKKYKPMWGVEIKWSNRYFEKLRELKSLIRFCKANGFQKALVTSFDQQG
jgi:hypothetical protein